MSETTPRPAGQHEWIPVTVDSCAHVIGPFFHGTRFAFNPGDELVAGRGSNYRQGRVMNHVYFSSLADTAAWGAELGTALAGDPARGHIYEVEPTGPFEDDPNVTNKRFPGNITHSYRTRFPVRILREIPDWQGHPADAVQGMLDSLAQLREQGLDVIED